MMGGVKFKFLAGTAALFGAAFAGTGAQAADPPPPPVYQPPPIIYQPPPPPPKLREFDGWYLRGDIGITQQKIGSFDNVQFGTAAGFRFIDQPAVDTGVMFGVGIGYQYNEWLRFDFTGEYRGRTGFRALDTYTEGVTVHTNDYNGTKREWLFLANAYVDLGTWWCITPFIGVGVGMVDITIDNFRDRDHTPDSRGGYANSASKQNFAWALHAGLSYKLSNNFAIELGYRYLDLGDAQSGDIISFGGINNVNNPMMIKEVTSHDLKLGLRWMCCDPDVGLPYQAPQPAYVSPPVSSGAIVQAPIQAPVYAPQPAPVYAPPPPQPIYTPQAQVYSPPAYQPPPQYAPPPQQYAPPPPPAYQPQPSYQPPYQPPLSRRG